MPRALLAIVAVALVGGIAVLAVTSVAPAPRTASSGAPADADAEAAADVDVDVARGGREVATDGPFAMAARQEAERSSDGVGYFEAAADRHRAAQTVRHTKRSYLRRRGRYGTRVQEQVVRDLADRLDVEEDDMRGALASVGRDTLSLPGVMDQTTWSDRKRRALADLARELGRPVDEVATATRNELEAKLGLGVTFGIITARGRELALRCFDRPRQCDVEALKRETTIRGRGAP